ncbi:MAG TPA: TadE/TadG family type IV pilus assembly protein [Terracidiphilus sp.]|nr:TadE/TadG family type IV pilus assembly protein [Terracidiphilus sp.]
MKCLKRGKWMGRSRRGETGQSLVEAALVAPIFFLLLMGAAELARVAYVAIEVSNAARSGAQFGAQSTKTYNDGTGIATAASDDASNVSATQTINTTFAIGYACSDGTTAIPPSTSNNGKASCASGAQAIPTDIVTSSVNFDPLIHIPGLPSTFTISSSATETCTDCP